MSEPTKRIIKCSGCKNVFFTKKVTLSKSEIADKRSASNAVIRQLEKEIASLEYAKEKINSKIANKRKFIIDEQKTLADLDFIVQCSSCGIRLPALENEVLKI